jgi:Sigma-70 region 2
MNANPFAEPAPTDPEDCALVARARGGDRDALEGLVRRHQSWIYNIAVRMLYHPQDAEDATQEILIKALTRLSSFEGRSRTNGGKMVVYAFDVDQTLWLSGGPITFADLMELRNSGHLLGLCGNFAAVTLRMSEWHYLFSFIGPMAMTKEAFLIQVRQYVPADEYVMVGNIQGISGESDDHGAASRAGWRFISETAFSRGAR